MKVRKKAKGTNKYKEIDSEIKKKCIEAREEWINDKCSKIEALSQQRNQAPMYEEIKKFTKTKTPVNGCVRYRTGSVLFETDEICKRWTEYVEELFH